MKIENCFVERSFDFRLFAFDFLLSTFDFRLSTTLSVAVYAPDNEHHQRLVERVIDLHGVVVVMTHEVFVVESGAGADEDSEDEAEVVKTVFAEQGGVVGGLPGTQ